MTQTSDVLMSMKEVESLSNRLDCLGASSCSLVQVDGIRYARAAVDPFADRMLIKAISTGFCNTLLVRCAPDYYNWTLERRREHLVAPTTDHLCKSIVLCNSRCVLDSSEDPLNSKYYCVIVQYRRKLKAEDLVRVLKKLNSEEGREFGNRKFNFRLADDCEGITGYTPNAVTPLGLKTKMPIVLDREITRLQPATFWMGGGAVDLKWRVDLNDFMTAFEPLVCDISLDSEAL
jgi:prolyl-tRNA editing enzyme YbaK/EbsC (Cys-tRNA(Pro) deacylase)